MGVEVPTCEVLASGSLDYMCEVLDVVEVLVIKCSLSGDEDDIVSFVGGVWLCSYGESYYGCCNFSYGRIGLC